MKQTGGMKTWINGENGNRASVERWGSEEKARLSLASLDSCWHCSDCYFCTRCMLCTRCTRCTLCTNCLNCTLCQRCSLCTGLLWLHGLHGCSFPRADGRVAQMVKDATGDDGCIPCHHTLGGNEAVCRGFFELRSTLTLRLAVALNVIQWQEPERQQPESPTSTSPDREP